MNSQMIDFLKNWWFLMILIAICFIPMFSFNLFGKPNKEIKQPIVIYLIHLFGRAFFEIGFAFGIRGTMTLIILVIIFYDLIYNQTINSYSITLVITGLVALYMDKLVETGNEIKLLGFSWKKDPRYNTPQPSILNENTNNPVTKR